MACLNDFMAMSIQAAASDWQSVNVSKVLMAASGSNPNPGKDEISTLASTCDTETVKRPQILVVDDNRADIFLIREAIEAAHVDADLKEVHDGQAALHFLDAQDDERKVTSPDLVLLDLNLPRVSGEDILKHLRGTKRYASTPVLIVTSSDSARERETVTQLGIAGYFRKPSAYAEFLKLGVLVKKVLEPL